MGILVLSGCKKDIPIAEFSSSASSIQLGKKVSFTDFSTEDPIAWKWTFENGKPGTSTGQNPVGITYDSIGSFSVTLEVENRAGTGTITKDSFITVNAPPNWVHAAFSASAKSISIGDTVLFTDKSTNDPISWKWTFEGGILSQSTEQFPKSIVYPEEGTYSVTLVVSNGFGTTKEVKTGFINVKNRIEEVDRESESVIFYSTGTLVTPAGGWGWEVWSLICDDSSEALIAPIALYGNHGFNGHFKCDASYDLETKLKTYSYPSIMVGGNGTLEKIQLVSGTYQDFADEIIQRAKELAPAEPKVAANMEWKMVDNEIVIDAKIGFFEEMAKPFYCTILLDEDKVFGPQAGRPDGEDYHRHVLRGSINQGIIGEKISTAKTYKNTVIDRQFSITKDAEWKLENLTLTLLLWEENELLEHKLINTQQVKLK